ncbi:hypothetical protein TUM20983_26400 [Mycobacterium antarcticum]|uniref:hypothetical protein n=1 Tax=Mycolicibacterium sp. TUM20983 TaxID=3023369 RepID=UPI00238D7CD5|nr:hypothetical protein [Mycolicibacterium sp. TUM20983]GLP75530.1 hypothetical protein TUM20983_26400 [Mycolicibacterium sp. TUM20983]
MSMTLAQLRMWPPEIKEVSDAATLRAKTSREAAANVQSIIDISTWEGSAGDASRDAMKRSATKFERAGLQALALAAGASQAHQEAQRVATMIDNLTADAHSSVNGEPAMDVDLTSNRVIAPNVAYMTEDAAAKAAQKLARLQGEIDTALAAGEAVDSDLARVIEYGTGGNVPPRDPWPAEPLGTNGSFEREQNQRNAFNSMFGRQPTSPSDWRTAAALDPHSYLPLTKGRAPNIVVGKIEKVPGAGVVQTNAFIDTETAPAGILTNAGDNRGFDPAAMPDRSRVSFVIDYENGVVVARQNPSIKLDDGSVMTGHPDISVGQESNGNVHINFNAADPFTPILGENTKALGVSVDGDLFYQPTDDGGIRVGGTTSAYPAWEVNHYTPEGAATPVLQEMPLIDHPLYLAAPGHSIGDTRLPYEFNNVILAPPGPAALPSTPMEPTPVGGIPPIVAVPLPTTQLGPVLSAPTIPVVDPVILPK